MREHPDSQGDRLRVLEAPAPRPTFREELWERVEAGERAATRRWRRIAIITTAIAMVATTAASVLALAGASGHVFDQTYSCTLEDIGGAGQATVGVGATSRVSSVDISTGAGFIMQNDKKKNEVTVDGGHCQTVARPIRLARSGLPSAGVVRADAQTPNAAVRLHCWVTKALVRLRVSFDGSGDPVRSTLAVRNQRTNKPIAFVQMSPPRVSLFTAPACRH
jgi:hypothetical protein